MLQVEKNLYEIQEQINMLFPYVNHILNPYNSYPKYLYHKTNGGQYIDTNITPQNGTRIEMVFAPLSLDNSFITGSDTLALFIKNGTYVFIVGNKLYTTNQEAILQEPVSIVLSKNGLTLNNVAYRADTVEDISSEKTILIGAAYDNNLLSTFATLNSIDDKVDTLTDNTVNETNLMTTLNSIDDETTTYEGDLLSDNGINPVSAKRIYSYKLSELNNEGIREYKLNLMATSIVEGENTIYCYYDMINNKIYKGHNDTGFLKGAQYNIDNIGYSVLDIKNASYGFRLNSNKYFESTNKGITSSYAICRLDFEAPKDGSLLQLDCINYAESNYDYGVFSNIDTELTLSNSDDTSTTGLVYKSFKGSSYETIQPVVYMNIPKGNHFIDIKFKKDGSGHLYNDSLQFKVVKAVGGLISVVKPDSGSYTFVLNNKGYYESNNKGVHNSYALCKVSFVLVGTGTVTFHCINYAENSADYGILSNIDTTLSSSSSADSGSKVKKSFRGSSSSSIQNVIYENVPAGEHFIYVKFRKDGSLNRYNDSLQFQIEIS